MFSSKSTTKSWSPLISDSKEATTVILLATLQPLLDAKSLLSMTMPEATIIFPVYPVKHRYLKVKCHVNAKT